MRASLVLLALISATAVSASHEARSVNLNHRQISLFFPDDEGTSSASASASQSSASAATSSSSAAAAESSSSASREAVAPSSSAAAQASASSTSFAAVESSSETAAASRSSAAAASSASLASASSRSAVMTSSLPETTVFLTSTIQAPSSESSIAVASSTGNADQDQESSGGVSKGLVIGVSVTGGVLILAAFIFLYMKFGGKRFSGFEDDDADIKWPELKHDPDSAAMQPLPARRTGGAGFDMGDESDNGHEIASVKGRDSFSGSTTALAAAPAGYAVNETYPIHQTHQTGHYYDMYNQDQQYPQDQSYPQGHQQQAAGYPLEQDAYPPQPHYGTDPYARHHM